MDVDASMMTADEDEAPASQDTPTAITTTRRSSSFDLAAGTVTIHDVGSDAVFALAVIHNDSVKWAAARGIAAFLLVADDPAKAYARLASGDYPRQHAKGKAVKLSPWREAIAAAEFERATKAKLPITLDDARKATAALPKNTVAGLKTDTAVIKHYRKANPSPVSLAGAFASPIEQEGE